MDPRDRTTNLALFGIAALTWLLVGLVITTRDPRSDPTAGLVGAGLMGIAVGLTCMPLFWLLGGNPYGLDWPNKGEIDVGEEIGREPTSFIATLHGQTTNPDHYNRARS